MRTATAATGLLTLMLLFSISCAKDNFDIMNLNSNRIGVLGHGGMGIEHIYPINSFESILNCISIGADGTEIDVQMTKDSVLVAFHDRLLEHSTTNTGNIYLQTWEEVKSATYEEPPFTNYRIVTLDWLFENLDNPAQHTFFLDCKNFNPDTSTAYLNIFNNALIKLIDRHNLENSTFIEFRRRDLIHSLRQKRPDLDIFIYDDFEPALETATEFELCGITTAVDNISAAQVDLAHANGFMVSVFNAHSKTRNFDAIDKQVDFIQSDKVKHLLKVLK